MYKKGTIMKIAVTYDNGKVFGHFGHTENFKLYDTALLRDFLRNTALKSSFAAESEREHRRH